MINYKPKMKIYCWFFILLLLGCQQPAEKDETEKNPVSKPQVPIMGWASWNNFRVDIDEDIIKAQADAMVETGLKKAGYTYINIDDGFFGGRDSEGNLLVHQQRFPGGMKSLSEYIHKKGLKSGIYSDAGLNTCASYWDKDTIGVGMGLYNNERKDLHLMLKEWDYDFIKVDWCGADWMGLDEEVRYTKIANIIRDIKPEVVYNICRWEFPGKWAVDIADSWRISGDVANTFESVMHIVDQNAELWRYAGPGHVNDMDMLQVGRGMSYEEDKAHFSMWCMLSSPLIAGNDLTKMSDQTLGILTNNEMIEINQDPLVYQARRLKDEGDIEVWAKPLKSTLSGEVAVALLNRSKSTRVMSFKMEDVGIDPRKSFTVRDVWEHKDLESNKNELTMKVPAHGIVVLKIHGESLAYNVFQYE